MKKLLFPPIVPNSLPAFDKNKTLKYYFKPSAANSMDELNHLQMSVVRLDTNNNILEDIVEDGEKKYPHGIIFVDKSNILKDDAKGFWYADIDASIFPNSDIPYKIQIRLSTDAYPKTPIEQTQVLKNLDNMSEWSIVTIVMPITIPEFGIQSFLEEDENRVVSTGYVFDGYYEAKDPNKSETLTSYRYNLYKGDISQDIKTWKLLSTSGEKYIGTDKVNMSYTFPYELKEKERFIVTLSIKTKNLYTSTKIYKVFSAAYPILEMFNSIDVIPNQEDAQMDITVRSKQILMKPSANTKITYFRDDPALTDEDNLIGTHAKIDGCVISDRDMVLIAKDGAWICQFKAMFSQIRDSLAEVAKNPNIEISQNLSSENNGAITRIKIGCMKINLSYPTELNKNPDPEWQYRFVVRKELVVVANGVENLILTQNRYVNRNSPIDPKQEYYFFIKEENGRLEVDVKETYLSTNTEI